MVAFRNEGKLYLVFQNDYEVQVYFMDRNEEEDDEEEESYYENFIDS